MMRSRVMILSRVIFDILSRDLGFDMFPGDFFAVPSNSESEKKHSTYRLPTFLKRPAVGVGVRFFRP